MYVEYCIIFVGTVYLNIGLLRYRHLVLYVCRFGSVINIRNYGAVTVEQNCIKLI